MKKFYLMAILALLAAFFIAAELSGGVTFTLTNVGTATLESVTVPVTGKSYSLGDLAPGSSKSIKVNPTGDSHIELVFADSRRLTIDCYIQPAYRGTITAEVTPTRVVSVKDEVRHVGLLY